MKTLNKLKRLQDRIADYNKTIDERSKEGKVQQRKETGGYHKPGTGAFNPVERTASKKKNRVKRTSKIVERLKELAKAKQGCFDLKRYA